MTTRAKESEKRLRDAYPQILRDAGLSEEQVRRLMERYDSPLVDTENPVPPASRMEYREPSESPPNPEFPD